MASTSAGASEGVEALELKGRMATLMVARVTTADIDAVARLLEKRMHEAPRLLRGAPMLLELAGVDARELDLQRLVSVMRAMGAVPVAIRGDDLSADQVAAAGLGLLAPENGDTSQAGMSRTNPPADETPAAADSGKAATRVVESPVRSGQQVYARKGDLVVLGAVGPGAEVLADGNIHIYGALRGRALAGVQGDPDANIFCLELEAELVSIAGEYQLSERFKADVRGRPARVHLDDDGHLQIAAVGRT